MDKTILIVEDSDRMRILIKDYLVSENFKVLEADNGINALISLSDNTIDLVILDIMMPEMDGWDVCRKIRECSEIPIIMLTSKSEEDDKLMGYELGTDDYITKPFNPQILVAKVKVLLKRTVSPVESMNEIIHAGNLLIDTQSHDVMSYGKIIHLTPKEYDLLLYLIRNKNIVLSRDKILDVIWGYDFFGDLRTVDTNIKRLRGKLCEGGTYINTIKGYGYMFEVKP